MIGATHPFIVRGLNFRDENGNYGCAHCGRPEAVHPSGRAPGFPVCYPWLADQAQ